MSTPEEDTLQLNCGHMRLVQLILRISERDPALTSLQLVRLVPEHLSVGVVCAHGVEAVVTKLDGKCADEDEEEHDQRPLASSCGHVEVLKHQHRACARRVKV